MAEPDKKRRLPIIQNTAPPEEDEAEPRPPWHWSGIGVVITFLLWLPIAGGLTGLTRWIFQSDVIPAVNEIRTTVLLIVVLNFLGFCIATFLGGFFIGKFGGEAGPKEGAVSGFVTAAVAVALATGASKTLSIPDIGIAILLLILVGGTGALSGRFGAKVGKRTIPRNGLERPDR